MVKTHERIIPWPIPGAVAIEIGIVMTPATCSHTKHTMKLEREREKRINIQPSHGYIISSINWFGFWCKVGPVLLPWI